jgi:hypothetical protein
MSRNAARPQAHTLFGALLCLVLGLLPRPVSAQQETFDILSFLPPPGWTLDKSRSGVRVYTTHGSDKWPCTLGIYESRAGSGDPGADFVADWKDIMKSDVSKDMATVTDLGDGWTRLVRATRANSADGQQFDLIFATYSGHGRVTSIRANVLTPACSGDAKLLIASVRAHAPAAAPTPAAAVSGGNGAAAALVGVWRGVGSTVDVSSITNAAGTGFASITYSPRLAVKQIAFLADGSFTTAVPNEGLATAAQLRKLEPQFWGAWTWAGGKGSVRVGQGAAEPFVMQNDKLLYDRVAYTRILPGTGQRLSGTFSAEKSPERYKGSVKAEPVITFGSDGSFADRGAIYWVRHVRGTTNDNADASFGDGSYDIADNTITFHYQDGRLIRLLFWDAGSTNRSAPAQIRLGASVFLDRK